MKARPLLLPHCTAAGKGSSAFPSVWQGKVLPRSQTRPTSSESLEYDARLDKGLFSLALIDELMALAARKNAAAIQNRNTSPTASVLPVQL